MLHYYVYRISCHHPDTGERYYYGSRSSKKPPHLDVFYWSSSRYVQGAIQELGPEWFSKKIIGLYPTREAAVAKEIRLHSFFNVKDHPLFFNRANQTTVKFISQRDPEQSERQRGNTYALGRTHSQATKEKIAASKRGQRHTSETRAKMAEAHRGKTPMLGKHHSKEIRDQMSVRMQGNTLFLGKHHSKETRKQMSVRMLGNTVRIGQAHPAETRERISTSMTDFCTSAENKAKHSLALRTNRKKKVKEETPD